MLVDGWSQGRTCARWPVAGVEPDPHGPAWGNRLARRLAAHGGWEREATPGPDTAAREPAPARCWLRGRGSSSMVSAPGSLEERLRASGAAPAQWLWRKPSITWVCAEGSRGPARDRSLGASTRELAAINQRQAEGGRGSGREGRERGRWGACECEAARATEDGRALGPAPLLWPQPPEESAAWRSSRERSPLGPSQTFAGAFGCSQRFHGDHVKLALWQNRPSHGPQPLCHDP